jgi:WD40 repeat protein/DNA-binding SARP family transcriptional activator
VQFRLLGPLEVSEGKRAIALGGPKQRAVLAHLLLHANEVVSTDALIDDIWGESPPEAARNSLQTYISLLRKALGDGGRIEARPPGYVIHLEDDELDALRFEHLVIDARGRLGADPSAALRALQDALALWRGSPLADLADEPSFRAEISRLEDLHAAAVEDRIAAELAAGHHAEVIGELENLVRRHPLRERLWAHLIVALYRSSRQADALDAYARLRRALVDELGIDPSPELQRLHEQVLAQDPGLDLRGQALRGYRLLEQIGEGSFGVVYRAIQPQVDRDVAVKVVRARLANDPDFIRRFESEAQIVARLEHPHIVPLYDYWREPDAAYLVMRLLRGGSLKERIARAPLDPDEVARLLEQVCSAIATAHRQGIVHRDVKPANVLLDEEGTAYLSDFGIAWRPEQEDRPDEFPTTSGYLSPEQIRGELITERTDIYSLGVVIYEALCGRHPFATENPATLAEQHLLEPFPPLGLPDLSDRVEEVIAVATAKDPDARYDSATELAVAFRAALGETLVSAPVPAAVMRNPYKGLRSFEEADAADFFGREALTDRLVARLSDPNARFVAVVGPSGSGKSSVVRAGLIPALRADAIPGSDRWFVVDMLPGSEPFRELERALLRIAVGSPGSLMNDLKRDERGLLRAVRRILPPGSELLLVVDQFEEVFTHVANEDARARFLDALVTASTDPQHSVRVMVTLRADFYDRPLRYRGIGELLRAGTEVVLPLAAEELERAVAGPAERVGVTIEREVVGAMVGEVAEQTGALPLLQYTLTELFERRKNGMLTLDAYRSIGGISGALVRRAEQIYANLDDTAKETTRQLFLRLVTLGDGSGDTRRRVLTTELLSLEEREDVMTVVMDAFGRHRLLTFDHDPQSRYPTVEVAHEALLTAWGRLRGWIDAAREDLRTHRRLAAAVADWTAAGQDASFLVRGNRLEQFEAWTATSEFALAETERAYLDASIAARAAEAAEERAQKEREAALQRRSGNRLRALVGVLAIACIIAAGLSLFAFAQRGRARDQTRVAEREERVAVARELSAAAVANLEVDPERSILLALEAVDRTRSVDGTVLPEAEEALHRAVLASRIVLSVPGVGGALDWSPTGVFVTEGAEETGIIDIRDAATGDSVLEFEGHDVDVNDVAFGPDGSTLATTGDDGALKVWDPSTGDLLSSLSGEGVVWGPSFSADGSMVAAAWPDEGSVRIMDPSTGRVIRGLGGLEGPFDTALSPNGRRLAVASGFQDEALVFDVASGEQVFELRGHLYPINSVSWSPDGRWIATGSGDSSVRIWDGGTGRPVFELVGHTGVVLNADWSPDGGRLVTSGSDATAKVWEIGAGGARELVSLSAQETRAGGTWAVFSPDGSHVMTGDQAISAVKIWDVSLSGGAEWANFPTDTLAPVDVAFLPDGQVVAPSGRGSVSVWDVETAREVRTIGPGEGPAFSDPRDLPAPVVRIDASSDGTRIATVRNFAQTVSVWDPRTGEAMFEVQHSDEVASIDWSADSGHLVVASSDGSATIVDRTGREVRVLRGESGFLFLGAAFSPDGRVLATSARHERSPRSRLTIWDWKRGKVVKTIQQPAGAGSVVFDPTGIRIATAGNSGLVEVWDVNSGRRRVSLAGHSGPVREVAFSPDGSLIATAGDDGTVRLFEADTGNQVLILRGHGYLVSGISFSPDGTRLASASPDGIVRIWALDLDDLIAIANREKTRSLTNEECGQYLHLRRCPNN